MSSEKIAEGQPAPRRRPHKKVRRQHGIYYSPQDVATALVTWAVRTAEDTVFDTSFGGCVFLHASVERLQELGAPNAPRRIGGTDKDPGAWQDAVQLMQLGADPGQFRQDDFMVAHPEDFGGPFTVVVGNPPYVRASAMSDEARRTARACLPDHVTLAQSASYWAYFVLHALEFVSPGGRMALILPGTFLRADYALAIRSELMQAFASVTVLVLDEHLFIDADEESVLLLAEGRGGGPSTLRVGTAKRDGLAITTVAANAIPAPHDADENWALGLFAPETMAAYDLLASRLGRLGDIATVQIGVVTGANHYFLVDHNQQRDRRIEDAVLRAVVSKSAELQGLFLTGEDTKSLSRRLFVPPAAELPPGAADYVSFGEQTGVNQGAKCSERKPWFIPRGTLPPDAFLSCMAWLGPRLLLNQAHALCTNTILAVSFQSGLAEHQRVAYAVGMLSTVSQLSAEVEGRVCGGGLLKLEPSDARRLVVPAVSLNPDEQSRLDTLCRGLQWDDARALVDDKLMGASLSREELSLLSRALEQARNRRWGQRKVALAPTSRTS